jgi:hypothetical protein
MNHCECIGRRVTVANQVMSILFHDGILSYSIVQQTFIIIYLFHIFYVILTLF